MQKDTCIVLCVEYTVAYYVHEHVLRMHIVHVYGMCVYSSKLKCLHTLEHYIVSENISICEDILDACWRHIKHYNKWHGA